MLNEAIKHIPMPPGMSRRPINERGFPVPWFVANLDGKYDFRVVGPGKILQAYYRNLCWLCGEPLDKFLAFTIGPMCAINRVSSEPPAHRDCAEYACKACPFLAHPNAKRNAKDLPDEVIVPGGIPIAHNPGAVLVWVTKSYKPMSAGQGKILFEIGPPVKTLWYAEGQRADRALAEAAINKGLPHLRHMAELDGREGKRDLERRYREALTLLPAE